MNNKISKAKLKTATGVQIQNAQPHTPPKATFEQRRIRTLTAYLRQIADLLGVDANYEDVVDAIKKLQNKVVS